MSKKGGGDLNMEAYTDADWAGSIINRRYTSRWCTFVGGNLVIRRSKKMLWLEAMLKHITKQLL